MRTIVLCGLCLTLACSTPRPPIVLAREHVELLDGERIVDPFRWMEDGSDPELRGWVAGRDAEARAWVARAPDHEGRLARLQAASHHERTLAPIERGGRYFFARIDAAATRTSWLVRAGWAGAERLLVDGEALLASGQFVDRTAWPSPDGRLLAVAQGSVGSSWRTVRVLDVERGRWLPDELPGFVSGGSTLAWHPSGAGVFVASYEPPRHDDPAAPFTGQRVVYRELGSTAVRTLVPPVESGTTLRLVASDDGRWLVLDVRDSQSGTDEIRAAALEEPLGPWRTVVPGGLARFAFLGSVGDELLFESDHAAPRGRILAARVGAEIFTPREIVPQGEHAIETWITNGTRILGESLVVTYRVDGRAEPRLFTLDGRGRGTILLPELASIWSGFTGRQGSDEAFFVASGFVDPGTVHRLDVPRGTTSIELAPELPYDPREFVTRQVFWSGPAGARLPMYLAHHRDTPPDGTRPVLVYGYAFGAWSAAPWFRPHMAEWMASGGTFALPALRGGGEYGEDWHQDGVRAKRQNAIDDFLACGRWLVANGLATPARLAAETNSAGASVVAAALVQAPDVYAAGILAFPLLDVLRYDQWTAGAAWRAELGTLTDPAERRALLAYAPIRAVRGGVRYPAFFVTPGTEDQVTPPCHAYKFVAALETAGAPNPVLLRLARGAGHAYGTDLASSIENFADQLSFLERVLAR
jgi:prolyl oligopeptidase